MKAFVQMVVVLLSVTFGLIGCKDLTGNQQLPAGTVNASVYNTPSGAFGLRQTAIYQIEDGIRWMIISTGLFTDEVTSHNTGIDPGIGQFLGGNVDAGTEDFDARQTNAQYQRADSYSGMQDGRAYISLALAAIAAYDTGAKTIGNPAVLRGELYALEGYAEILLADFFCSGVPLSTLDLQGDYTYRPSSTTAQVYQDVIAKEDSAIALAETDIQVLNLARVLKGRALLASDSMAAAGQAVALVPDDFKYELSIHWGAQDQIANLQNYFNLVGTVSDSEGINGLPYISSGDPRTRVVTGWYDRSGDSLNHYGVKLTFPRKYYTRSSAADCANYAAFSGCYVPFSIADGIEARLIKAEAAFRAGSPTTMVTILNQLRKTVMVQGQTTLLADTLVDPVTAPVPDSARVAMLFRERAFWLFLTVHRQGDLRRLLRQYRQWYRNSDLVYPTGPYHAPGYASYGNAVTASIPTAETVNPLFHGCLNRNP